MKILILLSLFVSTAWSAECKLTGVLASDKNIETSFQTADYESCRELAEKTKSNNFFNLIEKDDGLVETTLSFKEDSSEETIFSEDESNL